VLPGRVPVALVFAAAQRRDQLGARLAGLNDLVHETRRRGDERIREDVCDRLTDDPRIDASDIDIAVKDGEVTLSGGVRTRDEKRFAEDLIERISGVRDVNNNLKVKPADEVIGTARSGSSTLGLSDTPPPPPTRK
jgi:hypothetical protein